MIVVDHSIDLSSPMALAELKDIVNTVIGSCEAETAQIHRITNGTTNTTYIVEIFGKPTLIARINGPRTELMIDREYEKKIIMRFAKYNLAPPILASFKNGLVYAYTPGRSVTSSEVRNDPMRSLIARRLAELHSLKLKISQRYTTPFLFSGLKDYCNLIPETFTNPAKHAQFKSYFDKFDLKQTVETHIAHIFDTCREIVTVCHNDLVLPNILFDEEIQAVHFIDFEYAKMNYQFFDVANFFTGSVGMTTTVAASDGGFSDEQKEAFLRDYIVGRGIDVDLEEELEVVKKEIYVFEASAHLLWSLWSLIITRSSIERIARFAFDYAVLNNRLKVTAIHKANIQKLGDGLFLKVCKEIAAAEYPTIEFNSMIVDNASMQLVSNPQQFNGGIMLMPNLYGNIISNIACGLVGGPGLVSGMNLGKKYAVFETGTRNTGTSLAGKNIANPTAFIRAAIDMLRYLEHDDYANQLSDALWRALTEQQQHTVDVGGTAKATEVVDALLYNLKHK
uniref:Iso_dh domain-containing protein n=1 Tax=Panagrellus redivivus TaxID=6233 RepID=A0A7E4V080_PANRE